MADIPLPLARDSVERVQVRTRTTERFLTWPRTVALGCFVLFALTLVGIALFHRHTLLIALAGLAAITAYKLSFTGYNEGAGLAGLCRSAQPCRGASTGRSSRGTCWISN